MTKATPKEMLPVVDKPAIQYVVEEASAAGLTDMLMITGRNKHSLEDHFDHNRELEETLKRRGDHRRLRQIRAASSLGDLHFLRQKTPKGLGHAVLCAQRHIGDEAFAVLLGDDLIDPRDRLLTRMLDLQQRTGGSVVALMEVAPARAHLYGCAEVGPVSADGVVRISGLVEKPVLGSQPSNYAVIGRYVLEPAVFDVLKQVTPGYGGEIQLTDALRIMARWDLPGIGPMHGIVFDGRRYDTGDRSEYLRSVVRLACEHPELGEEFRTWLGHYVAAGNTLRVPPLTGVE